jgi:hypothetical protein
MWCEECAKVHVVGFVATKRFDEVNEKICYVMAVANEMKVLSIARLVEVQEPLVKAQGGKHTPMTLEDAAKVVVGDTSGRDELQDDSVLEPMVFESSSSSSDGENE